MNRVMSVFCCLAVLLLGSIAGAAEFAEIPRVLPPKGIEIPAETRAKLEQELEAAQSQFARVADHPLAADVEVFLKAVRLALEFGEYYNPKDFDKAFAALKSARERTTALAKGETPWTKQTGLVVRGYRSAIDGSAQPYGVVIPKNFQFGKPTPAYVWLHGRGDKNTDLHFLQERQKSPGQIAPPDAIVLHPFGRHCVGFKSAGEIDVLEVVEHAQSAYKVDPRRTALVGFSMGGAGAWHIGAHYTDRWCAVAPGAGFAETARYIRLKPEDFPPQYEQALWGAYDVPNYVRNLFNVPTIAYSGEKDRQIQAARVMEEAFQAEGRKLPHLIGPGVEHKYEPKTLEELVKRLQAVVKKGRDEQPQSIHLQTRTLRYPGYAWLTITGLEQHWADSRVDAERKPDAHTIALTTKNVTSLHLAIPRNRATTVTIDDQTVQLPAQVASARLQGAQLVRRDGKWQEGAPAGQLRKSPGLQGPIDDAFLGPFLVVIPTGDSPYATEWTKFELDHFLTRWKALMRGEARVVKDTDLKSQHIENYNLIVWGDPDSNRVLKQVADRLPVKWRGDEWSLGGKSYSREGFVPALIYPNPLNPKRYIVVNSGLTFREAHDRTNSLQNPKLPDWAVIDLSEPPSATAPGKIASAGFFDEQWQYQQPQE